MPIIGGQVLPTNFGSLGITPPESRYDRVTLGTPDSTLTNFSVPILTSNLSTEWKALVDTTDGTKGRVFLHNGTEIASDWIDVDAANGVWLIRAKVPTRTATDTTLIDIYPPLDSRASYAFGDTFGAGNAYASGLAAYHPDGGPFDRISNSNTLSLVGAVAPSVVTGVLGNATQYIQGTTGFYRGSVPTGAASLPRSGIGWVTAEIAAESGSANAITLTRAAGRTTDYEWYLHQWSGAGNDTNRLQYAEGGGGTSTSSQFTSSDDTDNHFISGVRASSASAIMAGATAADADLSSPTTNTTVSDPTGLDEFSIGANIFQTVGDAIISNVQLWTVALSEAWQEYEFDATKANASFITNVTHVA